MPQPDSLEAYEEYRKAETFLTLAALRSEARYRGQEWTRQRIADLKIDLHLATEQGDETVQILELRNKIERLENDLTPSIFDDPERPASDDAMKYSAAHLARQAIEVAFRDSPILPGSFREILVEAKAYLSTEDGLSAAKDNLMLVEHLPDVVLNGQEEVVTGARHLLDCLL